MSLTNIETTIILDLYDHDTTPSTIKAIQLDSNTRYVAAAIRYKGETYDIGASAGVTLTVIRPDRTGVQITGSPRAQSEFTPGGEEVVTYGAYAELSQAALAVKGTLYAQFMITSGGQVLRTEIFTVANGEALDASTSEWAEEYQGYNLDELVQSVNESSAKVDAMEDDVTDLKEGLNAALEGLGSDDGATISGAILTFNNSGKTVDKITVDTENASTVVNVCGKNIYPKCSDGSANDLTWTVASDGTITFSGTPSANTLIRLQNLYIPVKNRAVTVAFFNNMTNSSLSFFGVNSTNTGNWQVNLTEENMIATKSDSAYDWVELRFRVPSGFNATGLVIKPMLVIGASIDGFEEYSGTSTSVSLVDGVVQESITLKSGFNTVWANDGDITIKYTSQPESVATYVTRKINEATDSFYRYEVSGSARYLYIYYKSGSHFVRWQLHNVPSAASNSNTWQIGRICGVDDIEDSNLLEIVRGGEFELAFKENGASDYCGGNNHGDETTDIFKLFIDGKQITDLTTLADGSNHAFTRIDAFEIATVNRCDTPSEDILKHQKIWTFEGGKVKVRQTVKYLEELIVDTALVCMFAALRSAFPYGIRKGGVAIEDMTTSSYTKVHTVSDDIFYEYYGTLATAKVHSKTDNPNRTSDMWINNTIDLNKLYYGYYGVTDSAHPVTVPINSIITAESEYDVAYTPMT